MGSMDDCVMWTTILLVAGLSACVNASPYDKLGLQMNATKDDILAAYNEHSSIWDTNKDYKPSEIKQIIEIEHAYQLLSNDLTRRDYDYFNIDDLEEELLQARKQFEGEALLTDLYFPLWEPKIQGDKLESTAEIITFANFGELVMQSSDPWLIQIYSDVNPDSHRFSRAWVKTGELLEGVVKVGRLELGELSLALILAERNWLNGYPFFRNGLPAMIAVLPSCQKLGCITRYYGEKTADAITDWVATQLLKLPRILYYSAPTLMADIIQKPGPHKVKVIVFSYSGERAAAYLRKAAKDYWEYAVFAMVLWRESEATFWETKVGVETAPALVFSRDPGLKPVIHHGKLNALTFLDLMEMYKAHELPQLRSITAANLGCDASSYSLAGNETKIWYCVVVAGKPGFALNQMRGVLRGVQDQMTNTGAKDLALSTAVDAFRGNRLRLAWLDGELQKDVCYFYLNSDDMFEACGPKTYEVEDSPKIFLIRYLREVNKEQEADLPKEGWLPQTTWERQAEEERKYARQLVTKYSGSSEVEEIITWISNMVHAGDTEELPSFRGKAPELVPEESIPFAVKTHDFVSDKKQKILEKGKGFFFLLQDFKEDPKFIPLVLFVALFYTTTCFLATKHKLSQPNQATLETGASGVVAEVNVHGLTGQAPTEELLSNARSSAPAVSETSDGLRRRKEPSTS